MTALQLIDTNFIEGVLNEPVKEIAIKEGCKEGDNVAGSLKAITATLASGKQKHFIFKHFPMEVTQENGFVIFMKVFWRENSVYKILFPKLEEFAKSRGFEYESPTVKYYKGYNDDKQDYILLEDARPAGYIMPDKTISLTKDQVTLIMKEFATFHAISYAFLRDQGERIFKELEGFQYFVMDEMVQELMETNFNMVLKRFYDVAIEVLEKRYPEGAEKMRKYAEKNGTPPNTVEHLTDNKYFATLVHFDLWSNNMLIKNNKQDQPTSVKFIDFQFMQRGNIFSDLLYFMYTSTTPEFRKAHLHTTLNVYYDAFQETLEKIKTPLPCGFTKGFLIDEFEAGIISAFGRMTFAVPLQLGLISKTKTKDGENLEDAVADMHSKESIMKIYMESPRAQERMEALAREMVENKYL
ncbi:unnamed protein product [Orchesella dallaii]|uniref:CHK kinase-like domain-containing protein n=1 Tax=Orchesella dallaii TaxID=48710 RepID=A0ABP1R617_9HEXA